MSKKNTNKTTRKNVSVSDFINNIKDEQLRRDSKELLKIFKGATGATAKMWGTAIIGFGEYHYKYDSGREGDFLATGFSPRKSGPTIYIMPGYSDYSSLLNKLGPHKLGKSCLYLKRLDDIHIPTLKKLIKAGVKDLSNKYPVKMK